MSKFFPAFKGQQVSVARSDTELARMSYIMVAADREMTVQDILRHTRDWPTARSPSDAPVKDAYAKAGLYLAGVRDYDARDLTPAEEVERLAKAPLAHQPGTVWEYSMAVDLLGRVVEAASGKRLADFLDERVLKPLKMRDTAFWVPAGKISRLAQPLAVDQASGQQVKVIDVSKEPKTIPAVPARSRPRRTICASRRCCSTAASSTARAYCHARPSR